METTRPPDWHTYLHGLDARINLPDDTTESDRVALDCFWRVVLNNIRSGWYEYRISTSGEIEERRLTDGPPHIAPVPFSHYRQFMRFRSKFTTLDFDSPAPQWSDPEQVEIVDTSTKHIDETRLSLKAVIPAMEETVVDDNGPEVRPRFLRPPSSTTPLPEVKAYATTRFQVLIDWFNAQMRSGTGLQALRTWKDRREALERMAAESDETLL